MSLGLRRRLAHLASRTLQAALPSSLQSWGWAVRRETQEIADDTQALQFALGSLLGLMPRALAPRLLSPRALGIGCTVGAVALGLAYMAVAGAPSRYLAINFAALLVGLAMLALLGRVAQAGRQWPAGAIAAMAGALLATALLGNTADGAARWMALGGLTIQPSLVLLPLMIVAFTRCRNTLATLGILVAAAAVALQPDRAMAGMLAAGLAALAIMRPDRHVIVALVASIAGFVATLVRADTLPVAPYVDQILYSSFDVHVAAGAAVLGGSALLLVPTVVGWKRDPTNRPVFGVFGTVWLAGIVAAALGNYPTPLVGYGGSAIIGYALSLLALPKQAQSHHEVTSRTHVDADTTAHDRNLFVGLA